MMNKTDNLHSRSRFGKLTNPIISWKNKNRLSLQDPNVTISGFILNSMFKWQELWHCGSVLTSVVESHLSGSNWLTGCPVSGQHPSRCSWQTRNLNLFRHPWQAKQWKLKSNLFTDVNPGNVFVSMICYAVFDRLFFYLLLFSYSCTTFSPIALPSSILPTPTDSPPLLSMPIIL